VYLILVSFASWLPNVSKIGSPCRASNITSSNMPSYTVVTPEIIGRIREAVGEHALVLDRERREALGKMPPSTLIFLSSRWKRHHESRCRPCCVWRTSTVSR